MAKKVKEFKHESLVDPESIVRYLQALAEGFSNGSLTFSTNGREFVTRPNGLLNLRVEAKRGSRGSRVTLKVSWREDGDKNHGDGADPIRIGSKRS